MGLLPLDDEELKTKRNTKRNSAFRKFGISQNTKVDRR